jgi:hypothetical protein
MSIDFYSCARCGDSFPDCGDYCHCDECGNVFCSYECAELDAVELDEAAPEDESETEEYRYEPMNCCICRKEVANDYILLETLLRHYKITREDVLKMWQEEPDIEDVEEANNNDTIIQCDIDAEECAFGGDRSI